MHLNFWDIISVFMVMFAVIDIFGSIPIILGIKNKGGIIKAGQASIVAFIILMAFLFLGEQILNLFGVDISSFAIAGSFILLFLALEMVLGIELFKNETPTSASIVPIAFPLVAGAGSITSLLSLKAEYHDINLFIALFLNLVLVYFVLKSTRFFERLLGKGGILILKKIFGIILIAISIKLFLTNTGIDLTNVG